MSDNDTNGGSAPSARRLQEGYSSLNGRDRDGEFGYSSTGRTPGDRRGYAAKPLAKLPPPKNPGPAGKAPPKPTAAKD